METGSLRAAIGGTWFGAGLPSASLARLSELGRLRELGRGEVLLVEGAPTQELDLVLAGRVGVTAREPGRGDVTLMTVEPGDIVGWSALLAPMPATATVRVIEPARLVAFPGAELRAALAEDPVLAAAVHRQALDAVARRLMATRHQLLDLHAAVAAESWSEPW
ncbi:MAG: cyclic nucleotide-binding domain-containing protein [Chloroflexota bacterium]